MKLTDVLVAAAAVALLLFLAKAWPMADQLDHELDRVKALLDDAEKLQETPV